jgi:hypothetical protein
MTHSIAQDISLRARENRLRRVAKRRLGATVVKPRRYDPLAWDYGRFWLIVPGWRCMVIGAAGGRGMAGDPPGLTLDEAEAWLDELPRRAEVRLDELPRRAEVTVDELNAMRGM